MPRLVPVLLAVLAVSIFAVPAHAVLITVDFSVTGTDPVNNGITASGSFSFDSSIIPAGGGTIQEFGVGLESDLLFVWDGTTWDESNAGVPVLTFDSNGVLTDFLVGGAPGGFDSIGMNGTGNHPDDFFLYTVTGNNRYARNGDTNSGTLNAYAFSNVTWSVRSESAPEPSAWALLGVGLLGLSMARRRAS